MATVQPQLTSRQRLVRRIIRRASIEVECLPDDVPVRGNASAIDEETDRETEADIARQLDSGNEWAWCCVHVTLTLGTGLSADSYLGACSYSSERAFVRGGYYRDMVREAAGALADDILASPQGLAALSLGGI